MEMSRLTRNGLPNLPRETKFSRANADREILKFSSSADYVQDWQPYPVAVYIEPEDLEDIDSNTVIGGKQGGKRRAFRA